MLQITIPGGEQFDTIKQEFIYLGKDQTLQLEHSLVSLSKWESKWCTPFLSKAHKKTFEETLDYVKCMTITQNVRPDVYNRLTVQNFKEIDAYINAPMTATTFHNLHGGKKNDEIITSELVYYWMISLNIPFECQKWHLNRLLTLIQICNIKNQPQKKMSKKEIMSRNAALNEARRKQLNSKG